MAECKNCKGMMKSIENGYTDGEPFIIRECTKCGWGSETLYYLEEDIPPHVSWINEKGEAVDY